jgi:hypothetical protein
MCGLHLFYDAVRNVNIRAAYFARPAALRKINIGCCTAAKIAARGELGSKIPNVRFGACTKTQKFSSATLPVNSVVQRRGRQSADSRRSSSERILLAVVETVSLDEQINRRPRILIVGARDAARNLLPSSNLLGQVLLFKCGIALPESRR